MTDSFFDNRQNCRDNLTQVYNRDTIAEYTNHLISNEIPFSFALIDIDNFKSVNDTYGHSLGDIVIKKVSAKISETISEYGFIGRFGGDEFIIILPKLVEYDAVWTVCRSLSVAFKDFEVQELPGTFITITLGLARFPENAKNYETILETADKALYRGKMKGRNCFIIYLPEKHAKIVLKTEKDKSLSTMYLHSLVFKTLTKDSNLAECIRNMFNFLSSYFMFDHVCIQHGDKIYFDKIHDLVENKNFKNISYELLKFNIAPSTDLFYLTNRDHLLRSNQDKLHKELKNQKVSSICVVPISAYGKEFGLLRVDSIHQKIWQHSEMDIILTVAKTIGIILFDHNLTFETL